MKNCIRGFTLTELLIVIAILGILYSVAMPAYTSHMQEARRVEVQQLLLQHVAILERQYTRLGGYPDSYPINNTSYYTFSYQASADALLTNETNDSSTFLLKSSPTGSQSSDDCGAMTVNHQGATTGTLGDCWP